MNAINPIYSKPATYLEPEVGSIVDVNDHAHALALAAATSISSASPTSNVADAAPTAQSDTTSYAQEFFDGLLTLKPQPVDTQVGGVTKISYDYRRPVYDYIRNFGDNNNQAVYKFVSDQEKIVQTSLEKLKNSSSVPDDTDDPSIYGANNLKLGLTSCLTSLMFLDYTMKQWMTEIFLPSEESDTTLDTEFL